MGETVTKPKRPSNVEYAVCVHFDSASEMNYKVDRGRTVRTTARWEWWYQRAKIFESFVVPSLKAQNFQRFTLWGLFNKRDHARSESMRNLICLAGGIVALDGPRALREHYFNTCEWLCVILLDSDDLYHPEAFADFAKQKPKSGHVCFFSRGWLYSLDDEKLHEFDPRGKGPGPWLARWYPNSALQSELDWWDYRKNHRFYLYHHQMRGRKENQELPGKRFMGLIHNENTERAWNHKPTQAKIGKRVTGEERIAVLETFGIPLTQNWEVAR